MILNNVIMGSGEDLDAEFATQDNLIAQIVTALEGQTSASGGTKIETCTITLYPSDSLNIEYTNEKQELVHIGDIVGGEPTAITVVKGSMIFGFSDFEYVCSGGLKHKVTLQDWEGDSFHLFTVTGDGTLTL